MGHSNLTVGWFVSLYILEQSARVKIRLWRGVSNES